MNNIINEIKNFLSATYGNLTTNFQEITTIKGGLHVLVVILATAWTYMHIPHSPLEVSLTVGALYYVKNIIFGSSKK